jgi:hypothetical protein
MKKIKIFEEYTSQNYEKDLVDFLYEKIKSHSDFGYYPIYEDGEEEELQRPLTRGERAALARDYQIISEPQLAALYLKALGRAEGEDGAYLVMIDGIRDFGEIDPNTRAFSITNPALADAIGLESTSTVYRTVSKFINLIEGVGETSSEALYPKVIKAFEKFSTMNPVQISNLASECIQDSMEYTVNRDKAELSRDSSAKKREEALKRADLIGQKVYTLTNLLKEKPLFKLEGKAQRAAIRKIAAEEEETEEKIKDFYRNYLTSRKILNSATFYDK